MTECKGKEMKGIGLGLPHDLFLRQSSVVSETHGTVRQGARAAIPFSPELALARVPSYQFDGARTRTPPPTPVMSDSTPSNRPSLNMMPRYISPRIRDALAANPHQAVPANIRLGVGLGLGITLSPPVSHSAFPGPPTGPRRPIQCEPLCTPGGSFTELDPIVSPEELMQRDFPLTPGAPLRREFIQHELHVMPGALAIGSLAQGVQLSLSHMPEGRGLIGLGIVIDGTPPLEGEDSDI